ncbi:dihydroneopterin aldolase [Malaciobacter halophilus]|uniref:dihydroneopterin aldolase n=1 Tax=Malaciobacter halophilus TaxID=197482 RepID=A0A2N1J426_9BACT|nr:dihydroneopterin aldolase [Malaciobacter halophilus]AXH08706.1 dihydroneopterin aldolase [Malaciobacter halophilus]PKI81232.1 dihydroneopterin aldolase [Malaciobacter halophilus]
MKIKIEDLTFKCIIGILPFEREKKQTVIVTCKIKYKYKNKYFVNYADVAQDIEYIMKKKRFKLIEDAIKYLKRHIHDKYNVTKVKLTICKPHIMPNCKVMVSK